MRDTTAPPTRRLAAFVSSLDADRIPAPVAEAYQSLLLDTLGCALAASGTELAEQLGTVADRLGAGPCTLIGRSTGASPAAAALYNGALSHSLNYSALAAGNAHIGSVILGGILAAAEQRGPVNGRQLLAALVAAGETTTRLAEFVASAPQAAAVRHRWLLGQLLGYAGVAAGCAKILELDLDQTHSALGMALMQASGSMEVMRLGDVPAKAAYAAFPNMAGLTSALMAGAGVGGGYAAIEGELGLFRLFIGIDAPGPQWADDLGREFRSVPMHLKRWPVSVNVERFLAALAARGPAATPAPESIVDIMVTTSAADRPWLEPVESRRRPGNAAAAANSIQFSLATYVVHGDVPVGRAAEELRDDPEVLRLADRVEHRIVDDGPRSLVLNYADGGRLELEVPDAPDAGARAPEAVHEKLRRCAALAGCRMESSAVEQIVAHVRDLSNLADVGQLLTLTLGAAEAASARTRTGG